MECTTDSFDLIFPPKPRYRIRFLDGNIILFEQIRKYFYHWCVFDQETGRYVCELSDWPPDIDKMLYKLLVKPHLWM